MMACVFSPDPAGCFLGLVPWWVWALLVLAAVLLAWGFADKLIRAFKAVAGWPGVAAAVTLIVAIVGFVLSLFGRRAPPVSSEEQYDPERRPPRGIIREPGEKQPDWFKRVTGQDE